MSRLPWKSQQAKKRMPSPKKTQIKFKLQGREVLNRFLDDVPRAVQNVALLAFVKYIVGDARHGLKHPDAYRFVSRASAYGKVSDAPAGYFSWKQFRYVAALTKGFTTNIGNNRSGLSEGAYTYTESKGGYLIENPTAGAYFSRSDDGQARQLGMVGWRKVSKVISDNFDGAVRSANAAIKAFLNANKK